MSGQLVFRPGDRVGANHLGKIVPGTVEGKYTRMEMIVLLDGESIARRFRLGDLSPLKTQETTLRRRS
jgi:hypothetical protein